MDFEEVQCTPITVNELKSAISTKYNIDMTYAELMKFKTGNVFHMPQGFKISKELTNSICNEFGIKLIEIRDNSNGFTSDEDEDEDEDSGSDVNDFIVPDTEIEIENLNMESIETENELSDLLTSAKSFIGNTEPIKPKRSAFERATQTIADLSVAELSDDGGSIYEGTSSSSFSSDEDM